jgi:hypothetical protein
LLEQVESSMAYSQISRVRMETFSQSNMIAVYFGEDDISKAIPVLEREPKQTYELQIGSPEIKILLKDKWKQDPPMSDEQQTKLVLHGNQEKLNYWCKHHQSWAIHSPKECRKQHSERNKLKRSNGEPRAIYIQPARGMKNTVQTEPHSNSRTEQMSEFKAMDDAHKPHQMNRVKDRRWRYSNKSRRNP